MEQIKIGDIIQFRNSKHSRNYGKVCRISEIKESSSGSYLTGDLVYNVVLLNLYDNEEVRFRDVVEVYKVNNEEFILESFAGGKVSDMLSFLGISAFDNNGEFKGIDAIIKEIEETDIKFGIDVGIMPNESCVDSIISKVERAKKLLKED